MLESLSAMLEFNFLSVDLLVVYDGDNFRKPWPDDCLKLERRGESHGFLDSECSWDGDRLSVRFYAHGLSGGETAQGH
jgi:hypothetical protein